MLKPHRINTIPVIGIENPITAQLCSPVNDNELGDHPIPINQYGFPLVTYHLSPGNSQAQAAQGGSDGLYIGLIATLIVLSSMIAIILRFLT